MPDTSCGLKTSLNLAFPSLSQSQVEYYTLRFSLVKTFAIFFFHSAGDGRVRRRTVSHRVARRQVRRGRGNLRGVGGECKRLGSCNLD